MYQDQWIGLVSFDCLVILWNITNISRLREIPTVDPVSGDFRPQDGFLSFEKVRKKK